jgi:hypothetical protein
MQELKGMEIKGLEELPQFIRSGTLNVYPRLAVLPLIKY